MGKGDGPGCKRWKGVKTPGDISIIVGHQPIQWGVKGIRGQMGFQDIGQGQSVHCLDFPVCDVATYALLGHRVRNSEVQAL